MSQQALLLAVSLPAAQALDPHRHHHRPDSKSAAKSWLPALPRPDTRQPSPRSATYSRQANTHEKSDDMILARATNSNYIAPFQQPPIQPNQPIHPTTLADPIDGLNRLSLADPPRAPAPPPSHS